MYQAVAPRQDRDKGTKVHQLGHLAFIDPAHFDIGGDQFDAALRLAPGGTDHRGDLDCAVILDVDGGAGLLGNLPDHRATLADHVADFFGIDLQGNNRWGPLGHLGARGIEYFGHFAQDVQTAVARLCQCHAHDFRRDSLNLDVHLQGGDAVTRPGDLEIHVTEMVFVAQDIGEHLEASAFEHQAHRHTRHRRLDRHARIHQRQTGAADAGHRAGTVGLEYFRDHADDVRKSRHVGHHRVDAAAGQVAVADFPALGTAHHAGLAHRKGREVVMQHEALAPVAFQGIDDLRIARGAEGGRDQRLGLAAREQRRAVGARQHTHLDSDRSYGLEIATVDAWLAVEDAITHDLAFETEERIAHLVSRVRRGLARSDCGRDFGLDFLDARVALLLLGHQVRVTQCG